jgi:hypothetical protein
VPQPTTLPRAPYNYRTKLKKSACFGINKISIPVIGKKKEELLLSTPSQIITPLLVPTHPSPVPEVCNRPDKPVHYNILSYSVGAFMSDLALGRLYSMEDNIGKKGNVVPMLN